MGIGYIVPGVAVGALAFGAALLFGRSPRA